MILFKNKGELDMRAATIIGVNAKESDDPIGYFGQGLKDAIGVLLRNRQRLIIHSGLTVYEFFQTPEVVRGKEFGLVMMKNMNSGEEQRLGFTTDIAKDWKMWMAYREIHCNSKDESGDGGKRITKMPKPVAGETHVIVAGDAFEAEHEKRHTFILEASPWLEQEEVEIHRRMSHSFFYKGIKVADLSPPSLFTYNVFGRLTLTTDRTCASHYNMENRIAKAIILSENREFLEKLIKVKNAKCFETSIDLVYSTSLPPSETFMKVVGEAVLSKTFHVPENLYRFWRKHAEEAGDVEGPRSIILTEIEEKQVAKAIAFCHRLRYFVEREDMSFTDGLGSGVMGAVLEGKIYIDREAFSYGTKTLAATMIEEFLHKYLGLDDCSRAMQEHLFQKIVSIQEEIDGEPL